MVGVVERFLERERERQRLIFIWILFYKYFRYQVDIVFFVFCFLGEVVGNMCLFVINLQYRFQDFVISFFWRRFEIGEGKVEVLEWRKQYLIGILKCIVFVCVGVGVRQRVRIRMSILIKIIKVLNSFFLMGGWVK